MNMNPPVTDWVHDWDHTDPQWTEDPFPIWDELRTTSPIVHTRSAQFTGPKMLKTRKTRKKRIARGTGKQGCMYHI